jgi:hypothetical protein
MTFDRGVVLPRTLRVVLGVGGLLIVAASVSTGLRHAGEPVYQLPTEARIVLVLFGSLSMLAILSLFVLPRVIPAVAGALIAFCVVWGVLAIFSIGILLLVGAVVLIVLLVRMAGPITGRAVLALAAGVLLAIGLSGLVVVAAQPPIVRCSQDGGAAVSGRYWWGGGADQSSGTGWARPDGRSGGTVTLGGRTYRYACRGGKLVRFTAVAGNP